MTLELESAKVHKRFHEYKLKLERGSAVGKKKTNLYLFFLNQ